MIDISKIFESSRL